MRYVCVIAFLMLLCAPGVGAAGLYSRFKEPPPEYSPVPFWFLNGALDETQMRWQMDQMLREHVHGAFMHARTGLTTPYLSDDWWRAIGSAVDHASEIGFQTWIYDEYNWGSGQAGGQVTDGHPEFLPHALVITGEEITGPSDVRISIDTDDLLAVLAAPVTEDGLAAEPALNLTDRLEQGILNWSAPDGKWLVMTAADRNVGRYVDVLNPDAIDGFLDLTHREYHRRFGSAFAHTIPGTFTDEPNLKWMPAWTHDFLQQFQEIKGYDFTPYLGVLYHCMGDQTIKLRCDYFDVLTTLYERRYWGAIGEWAAENGIVSTGHLDREEEIVQHMRLAGDAMRCLRHAQIPGVDCVEGPRRLEIETMKLGSSVAHLYGRERVMCEMYAGCGHALTFEQMKWMADWAFAGGINFLAPHAFHYSIEGPGDERRNDWPPSMFYQQPYWPHYHLFADYVSRLSSVLSGGVHVSDIAVYYPIKTLWANFSPAWVDDELCPRVYREVLRHLFEANLDYDLVDDDSLVRAQVQSDTLRVDNLGFRVIVLPAAQVLPVESAKKLIEFQESGGTVICVGRIPDASAENGVNDPVVKQAVKNAVFVGTAPGAETIIRRIFKPDFRVLRGDEFYCNHIRHSDCDVYFISSQLDEHQDAELEFRATGHAEIWDAATGERYAIDTHMADTTTRVCLPFAPYESRVVVFNQAQKQAAKLNNWRCKSAISLPKTWKFKVKPYAYRGQELPDDYTGEFDCSAVVTPGDWCELGLSEFSGAGTYHTSFEAPELADGQRLLLDLGDVWVAASVSVNEMHVGARAWRPFVFDLTPHVRCGDNVLSVEVTNTIANRMTAFKTGRWDSSPPERLVSGLLGPIRLDVVVDRAAP